MIPILYWPTEKNFTSNGVGRLAECISCTVEEERNGIFECEFVYPVTGAMYEYIENGMIVSVTHDDTGVRQPFEIYRRSAPIDGLVTFNAHHITYGASNVIVGPFGAAGAQATAEGIENHLLTPSEFTFETDSTSTAVYNLTHPSSIRGMLAGEEGSILDTFGGELEYDNFTIRLLKRRGEDTDVTIRYGKNLIDLTHEEDYDSRFNAILPYWVNSSTGGSVYGSVVYASGIPSRVGILCGEDGAPIGTEGGENVFEISATKTQIRAYDFSTYFETQPTAAQLEALAASFLENNRPWLPNNNLTVDFVQLAQTDEYAEYAPLQSVNLCDTVSVYHPALGLAMDGVKVIRTRYNVLLDKYDEIELGDPSTSFADTIETGVSAQITAKINETLDQEGVFNRLTNNGASQGIYIEDGIVYINASFIQSGTLKGVEFVTEESGQTYTGVNDTYRMAFRFSAEGMQIVLIPNTSTNENYDASSPIIEALMSTYVSADTGETIDYPIMSVPEAKLGNIWYEDMSSGDDTYTTIAKIVHDLYHQSIFIKKTYTRSGTVNGSSTALVTATNLGASTPTGYTPVAFTSVILPNGSLTVQQLNAAATGSTTMIGIKNTSTSNITYNLTATVLYVATAFIGS